MASLHRRLHALFSKSVTLPRTSPNSNIVASSKKPSKPPPPPPIQTDAKTTSQSSSSKKEKRLKKMVEQCKHFSSSPHYRNRYKNYESIVLRLASANQFSMIEDVVEHLKTYSDITNERYAIRLISLYGKSGMFDHAQKVFDEMPKLNCERTVLSMNALLYACISSKKFDKFTPLFDNLPVELSVDPDLVTYNTVIKALCNVKSFDLALSVLEKMEEINIEPDLITFNTLLAEFYSNNRFSDGEMIWAMIQNKNLVHNIRSYNSRIRGLVCEGRLSEAVESFEEMKKKGLKPDVFSYNAIIKGFCDDGNLEEAKMWWKALLGCGCVPDKFTYATIVPFLCENGDFDSGFEICKQIFKRRSLVNVALIQGVLDGLVKESKKEEAAELVKLAMNNDHHCYKLEFSSDT